MTALKNMCTPKIKEHLELKSGGLETYDQMRKVIMSYAIQRRMYKNTQQGMKDSNNMDMGVVTQQTTMRQGKGPHWNWDDTSVGAVQESQDRQEEPWSADQWEQWYAGGQEESIDAVGKGKSGQKGK